MLTGVHFLLTYSCDFECDHCFLYCGPHASGTFTLEQMNSVFDEIKKIGSITGVYFEGGEPFKYYPLMLEGIRIARASNLTVGIVTNAFWANSEADAELWLRPLLALGIDDLSISDDIFHQGTDGPNTAQIARKVAERMGFPAASICITEPTVERPIMSGLVYPLEGFTHQNLKESNDEPESRVGPSADDVCGLRVVVAGSFKCSASR